MSENSEIENIEDNKDDDDVIVKPKKTKRVMSEKQAKQFEDATKRQTPPPDAGYKVFY